MPGGVPARAGGRIVPGDSGRKERKMGGCPTVRLVVSPLHLLAIPDDRGPSPPARGAAPGADRPKLGAGGAVRGPRRRGGALRPSRAEPDRLRELQAGQPAERMGHQRTGGDPTSRASPPTSASTTARPSTSRSTPTRPTTGSTSTGWATTAAMAPARSPPSTRRRRFPRTSRPA